VPLLRFVILRISLYLIPGKELIILSIVLLLFLFDSGLFSLKTMPGLIFFLASIPLWQTILTSTITIYVEILPLLKVCRMFPKGYLIVINTEIPQITKIQNLYLSGVFFYSLSF
jgi:hypothetical protein